MEDEDQSDDEEHDGQNKKCDHTYLGMILEDNSGYLNMVQEEEKNCGVCEKKIDSAFYRCNTCIFEYVCCKGCYGKSILDDRRKRSPKKKLKYDC